MKSTPEMRARIRELMTDPQDDYDRAVECVLDDLDAMLNVAKTPRPFYGAECPSYPACNGGCGLGCTKEIERSAQASLKDEMLAFFLAFFDGYPPGAKLTLTDMETLERARAQVAALSSLSSTDREGETDHIDWDILAEERLGQRPRSEHGRHIPQTSPAPGDDSGSHSDTSTEGNTK